MLRVDTSLKAPILKGFMVGVYHKLLRKNVVPPMAKGLKQGI